MDTAIDRSRPPARQLLWLELRGIWELQAFFAAYPLLRLAPRGDGHPVLVLPGLAASDTSTRPLRAYLTEQGYAAHGWKQGRNQGPRPGVEAGIFGLILVLVILVEPAGMYGRWTKIKLFFSTFPMYKRDSFRRQKTYMRSERLR